MSGDVNVGRAGRLAFVRSVSGDVMLTDVTSSDDLTAGSVSGNFVARGLEARILDINTVSGNLILEAMRCERRQTGSVSGNVDTRVRSPSGAARVSRIPGMCAWPCQPMRALNSRRPRFRARSTPSFPHKSVSP